MSLRNRLGSFLLLAAAIFLIIFLTAAFSPNGSYEVMALLAGAVLLVVGWRWRMAKGGGGPPAAAPPPPPKKQGLLTTLLRGPGMKKTAPKAPAGPGVAPGGGPKGGGKPAAGKPGGAAGARGRR